MRKVMFQQGDLIVYTTDKIPEGVKQVKLGKRFTLLKGEGVNTHDLINAEGKVKLYEKDGVLFLNVSSPCEIEHTEHGIQIMEPGLGDTGIEQTFDYEDMESRNKQD